MKSRSRIRFMSIGWRVSTSQNNHNVALGLELFLYLFSSKIGIFHKFLYRTFWYSRNYTYFYFLKWRYKPRMVLKITNLHILRYLPTCWLYLLECYTIDNQWCTHTASAKIAYLIYIVFAYILIRLWEMMLHRVVVFKLEFSNMFCISNCWFFLLRWKPIEIVNKVQQKMRRVGSCAHNVLFSLPFVCQIIVVAYNPCVEIVWQLFFWNRLYDIIIFIKPA